MNEILESNKFFLKEKRFVIVIILNRIIGKG